MTLKISEHQRTFLFRYNRESIKLDIIINEEIRDFSFAKVISQEYCKINI